MKKWSINVFLKGRDGSYATDLFRVGYKWTYESYEAAKESFDRIPVSENRESLCELIEWSDEGSLEDVICLESKYSTPFASQFIKPGIQAV